MFQLESSRKGENIVPVPVRRGNAWSWRVPEPWGDVPCASDCNTGGTKHHNCHPLDGGAEPKHHDCPSPVHGAEPRHYGRPSSDDGVKPKRHGCPWPSIFHACSGPKPVADFSTFTRPFVLGVSRADCFLISRSIDNCVAYSAFSTRYTLSYSFE
jgi:hypothetical protein